MYWRTCTCLLPPISKACFLKTGKNYHNYNRLHGALQTPNETGSYSAASTALDQNTESRAGKQPLDESDPNMPFERAPSFNWVSVDLVNFIFIFYFNMGCWLQY
jgi:hypothetical protein